jgi:hypothetical protein
MRPDLKLKDRVPFYTKQIKKVLKVQSVKLSKKSAELKKLDLVELAKKLLALAIQKSEKIEILEHSKILEWMQLQVLELDKNEKLFEKQNRVILKLNEHLDDICRILRKERKEIPVKVVANDTRDSESESEQVILDQEWDSGDDQELEKPVERKKNRRGQQARRAYL